MTEFQEDISCEWPWSIEFRHKYEARKVLFVIPPEDEAGNGLQLLENALGNRQDYFPPKGVHLANELLLCDSSLKNNTTEVILICPAIWFLQVGGNHPLPAHTNHTYLRIEEEALISLIKLLKGKYHLNQQLPRQAVA